MAMKVYKLLVLVIGMFLTSIFVLSCSDTQDSVQPSVFPPFEFSKNDLIGTWQGEGEIYSDETLALYSDYKFHQEFHVLETGYHAETRGVWEIKTMQNGCTYIYLYDMKYFYQDIDLANNGNTWASGIKKGQAVTYWDECSENIIEMPNKVVLFVSQFPNYPRNIVLRHMAIQRNMTDRFLIIAEETVR